MISIRTVEGGGGQRQYYVHYVDYNKRLDEWVTEDRLDVRRIEPPSTDKDKSTTGINTPKKTVSGSVLNSAVPSRFVKLECHTSLKLESQVDKVQNPRGGGAVSFPDGGV